jgi:5-methyltetrahydrofolate--homocysteine methyltransferase
METILYTDGAQVKIRPGGPVVVIGEKINPTGRKKLAAALEAGSLEPLVELATMQAAWGADVLDVNVGAPGVDETVLLPAAVKLVSSVVKTPLCLDSANPEALAAALPVAPGKPLVNSVNGEEKSLQRVLPLVKERGAAVIGLTMDDNGIPATAQARLALAGRIIDRATAIGIPLEDVVIDPLVLTVGADSHAAAVTLETIQLVRDRFGANINLGASNVSFGLPDRHTINQAFLALAIGMGATCVITDPLKLTATIRAADLLLGRDGYARRWVSYFRQHPPEAR